MAKMLRPPKVSNVLSFRDFLRINHVYLKSLLQKRLRLSVEGER